MKFFCVCHSGQKRLKQITGIAPEKDISIQLDIHSQRRTAVRLYDKKT